MAIFALFGGTHRTFCELSTNQRPFWRGLLCHAAVNCCDTATQPIRRYFGKSERGHRDRISDKIHRRLLASYKLLGKKHRIAGDMRGE